MDLLYFGTVENARAFAEEATGEPFDYHRTFRFWDSGAWRSVEAFTGNRSGVCLLGSSIMVMNPGRRTIDEWVITTIPLDALVAMDVDDPSNDDREILPGIFIPRPVARWVREPETGFMVRFVPETTNEYGRPRPRAGIPGKP